MYIKIINFLVRNEKILTGFFLCFVIFIIWSWTFNILSLRAWVTPLGYQGDAWLGFAIAKTYMTGEINPFFYQYISTLNAPHVANWNDYPVTEDILFMAMGWLGRVIGLYAAANLMVLLAHVLAGLSFWYVCRNLKYKSEFAFAGAIVYSFSHYIMARGLGHLVLTHYWHIPLLLMVTGWVFSKRSIPINSNKFIASVVISIICGALNPYYTAMFLQFLGFGLLLHVVRKQYSGIVLPTILIIVVFTTFLLMNANILIYALENGKNLVAGARNLASLEVYALKIPELVLSSGNHPIKTFVDFSQKNYFEVAFVKGEYWSPYLGFAASTGLILLAVSSLYRLFQGKLELIPIQFWLIVWILLYSIVGGFNLLLGTFGLEYFRATNRYSIFILTICLIFLVKFLSRNCKNSLIIPVAFILIFIGLSEEMQGRILKRPPAINPIAAQINSDKAFSLTVEGQMPNAMVFQLPVAGFPEVGPINKMGDYEHFRPYLYTNTLHYSYGTNKGRGDTDWQSRVSKLHPSDMAKKLEAYGFGVIMINKKGFVDGGKSLINDLLQDGKKIISENVDLVAFKLQPSLNPEPVDSWVKYETGWSDDEGTHRWSKASKSKITVINNAKIEKTFILEFKISSLSPGVVSIGIDDYNLSKIDLNEVGLVKHFPRTKIKLRPGKNSLVFDSNIRPVNPQNGDNRLLSFKISDFTFESEEVLSKLKNEVNVNSPVEKLVEVGKIALTEIQQQQVPTPVIQDHFPRFGSGWSTDEGTHRWADSGHAEILITNHDNRPRSYSLEFKMTALTPRIIDVSIGSKYIGNVNIEKLFKKIHYKHSNIILQPGVNILSFDTITLPVRPNNGDYRKLSFQISELIFEPD